MQKRPLLGLTLSELQNVVKNLGMPGFSAKQIASWLYDKKVTSIDEMSNLSLKHRELLKEIYEVGAEAPVDAMRSVDGTVKYLYRAGEGHFVEAVYIPDEDRATLCVSSQVGCKMNCKFCMTGKQGFTANLTSNQIINQINSLPERDKLTNVVMMGMGGKIKSLPRLRGRCPAEPELGVHHSFIFRSCLRFMRSSRAAFCLSHLASYSGVAGSMQRAKLQCRPSRRLSLKRRYQCPQ